MFSFPNYNYTKYKKIIDTILNIIYIILFISLQLIVYACTATILFKLINILESFNLIFAFDKSRLITTNYCKLGDNNVLYKTKIPGSILIYETHNNDVILYANEILFDFLDNVYPESLLYFLEEGGILPIKQTDLENKTLFFAEPFIDTDYKLPRIFKSNLNERYSKNELKILVEELKQIQSFFKSYKPNENFLNLKLHLLNKPLSVYEINNIKNLEYDYTIEYDAHKKYKGFPLESNKKIIYFKDKITAFSYLEENNKFYFNQIKPILKNPYIDYILYYQHTTPDYQVPYENNVFRYHYKISNSKFNWYFLLEDSFIKNITTIDNKALFYHFGLYYNTTTENSIYREYLEVFKKNEKYFLAKSQHIFSGNFHIYVHNKLFNPPQSHLALFLNMNDFKFYFDSCWISEENANSFSKSVAQAFFCFFPNYSWDPQPRTQYAIDQLKVFYNYLKQEAAIFDFKEFLYKERTLPFDYIHILNNCATFHFDIICGIDTKINNLSYVFLDIYKSIKDNLIYTYYADLKKSPEEPRCIHFGHHTMYIIADDPWLHWDFKAMRKAHIDLYKTCKTYIEYYIVKYNDYANYLNHQVSLLKPYRTEKIPLEKKESFRTFVFLYKEFHMKFNSLKYVCYYNFKINYVRVIYADIFNYIKSYMPTIIYIEDELPKKKKVLPYKVHYVNYDVEIAWNNTNIRKQYIEAFKEYNATLKKYNSIFKQYSSFFYYNLKKPLVYSFNTIVNTYINPCINTSIDHIKKNYNSISEYCITKIVPRIKENTEIKIIGLDKELMAEDLINNLNKDANLKNITLIRITILDLYALFFDCNKTKETLQTLKTPELELDMPSPAALEKFNSTYENLTKFFLEFINNQKKNTTTKEELQLYNYFKKDIDQISKNYEKIHFENFKVNEELLKINIQSTLFLYLTDFNFCLSYILKNIQNIFNYYFIIKDFITEFYNIFFIKKTYMIGFADYFKIWDERIKDYHHDKFPPLLYLLDKETMVSEEDFFYMVINEMPAGDGGCYNRQLFKKHHTYQALLNYMSIIASIEQDTEKYQYMRRFLKDLKETSDKYFPGIDLKVVKKGALSNSIATLGALEKYLGFESTVETYRDDERRFYKYHTWYHNATYLSNMSTFLSRGGKIKSSLNMHRDLIADQYINYLLNNDSKYNNLHGFLHSDLVNLLFTYIPVLFNLLWRANNLYYEINYYGDDFDFLIKSNKEGLAYNAKKFLPYSFFNLYFDKKENPHAEYVLDTLNNIVDSNKMHVEQSERLDKNIESQIKKYYPNIGANTKANFTKYMNYLYKKYQRMMDNIPTLYERSRDPLISELFTRRQMNMLEQYFFDPTVDFNGFLEEIDFKYPHPLKYQFTLGRYDPHASYRFRARFTDEINALSMAYVENFLEVYEVWIGCKFEFLTHTLHQNLPVKTFTDTLIYKIFHPISPELCYFLGYLQYSFLIYAYKYLVADAFLFLMFEILYKLNTSNFFYGFSGYFLYMFICILGLSSCIFLVSNVGQRSSTILRLIAFESALVSFMMAIFLMHIRQQFLDELLDETTDWATFRMFIFYTIEESPLFYYFGKSFWTLFFVLFCLLAFECAFGLILIIIAYNKITHFTKAYYSYNKPEYIHVDLGFGAEYDIASSKFYNYFSSGIDTDHVYRNGYGKIELSPSDIYNDFISDDVKKYIEKKQEKDVKEFEKKYENK